MNHRWFVLSMTIVLAIILAGGVGYLIGRHHLASHPTTTETHRGAVSTHQRTTSTSIASSTTTEPPAPSTTSSGPTEVDVFAPWTPDETLSPEIKVIGHLADGNCWERSLSDSSDPDAWRCTSGNEIVDPCFAPGEESHISLVACAQSPWAGVELLSLSQPLVTSSAGSGPGTGYPWFLQLENGQQCGLVEGTQSETGGITLSYGCPSGYASAPAESGEPWLVEYLPNGSDAFQPQVVTVAWR
jgi:hypothetical protein